MKVFDTSAMTEAFGVLFFFRMNPRPAKIGGFVLRIVFTLEKEAEMVRWILLVLILVWCFAIVADAGILNRAPGGSCSNCPGGVCPVERPAVVKEKIVVKVPVEAVVVAPKAKDEIKAKAFVDRLAGGKVSGKDFAKVEKEVPAKTIRKMLEQRWDIATCGMYCKSHGSKLYDVYDDGTVEPAKEQPDEAPQEGVNTGSGNRFRLFRGRR